MDDPFDSVTFETNEFLNAEFSRYTDLRSLISEINQHDAPGSPPTNDDYALAADYDPNQFDIYIKNETSENEQKSENNSKLKNILPSPALKNTAKSNDTKTDFVKYGRGWVKKYSEAYHDMRKRNNDAIHKCRKNKGNKTKENKETNNLKECQKNKGLLQELVKEMNLVKDFYDHFEINGDRRKKLDLKYNELNNLLKK